MNDAVNLIFLNFDKLPDYIIVEPWRAAVLIVCWLFVGATLCSGARCLCYRIRSERSWKSWVRKRSYCNGCGETLDWWKVIPIVGALLCKGKCKKCGYTIGYWESTLELLCGVIVTALLWLL